MGRRYGKLSDHKHNVTLGHIAWTSFRVFSTRSFPENIHQSSARNNTLLYFGAGDKLNDFTVVSPDLISVAQPPYFPYLQAVSILGSIIVQLH